MYRIMYRVLSGEGLRERGRGWTYVHPRARVEEGAGGVGFGDRRSIPDDFEG